MSISRFAIRKIMSKPALTKFEFPSFFVAVVIGLTYLSLTSLTLESVKVDGDTLSAPYSFQGKRGVSYQYEITYSSSVSQTTQLSIVSNGDIRSVVVNDRVQPPLIEYQANRMSSKSYDFGDVYAVQIESGSNRIFVNTDSRLNTQRFAIGQKRSTLEYLLIFVLILLPLCRVAYFVFLKLINLSAKASLVNFRISASSLVLIAIVGLGILLRVVYLVDMEYSKFQHDYHGHIEYIKFYAEHFSIPLPHKGWEFPQQPLYYVVCGSIYAALESFGFEQRTNLWVIAWLTLGLSCLALIFAARLVRLLTQNTLTQALCLSFLAFTPSIVYSAARINNDPWVFSLATIALFYIVASYKAGFQRYFTAALVTTSLLFLTKISAVGVELMFLILLVKHYLESPEKVKAPLFHYCWVGTLILSYTVFRAYYPATQELVFVNSGIWSGQDLRPMDAGYFLTFHFSELFEQGQSYIRDKDTDLIKFSFPTYQYGTMIFGQFDYEWWLKQSHALKIFMQLTILFTLIVPLSWIAYFFTKKTFIDKLFIMLFAISFVLVLKFMFAFPSISNTDFRYYSPIFFLLAYFFASGAAYIADLHRWLKKLVVIWTSMLAGIQLLFFFALLSV